MTNTPDTVREQISALADGDLHGDEVAKAIGHLGASDELRATWRAYHVVGDVLRAGRHSPCSDSDVFLKRLRQRLADEPAPGAHAAVPIVLRSSGPLQAAEAANEPVFRWKLVAGVASLAAAAAIGWNWVGSGGASPAGAQLAQQQQQRQQQESPSTQPVGGSVLASLQDAPTAGARPAPTRVLVGNGTGSPQVMLRDARLDQLLEAHRQAAGGSQMPSGFLRNATFEGAER